MTQSLKWPEVSAGKPVSYFSTMPGQAWLASKYPDVHFEDRPVAWCLPSELGPWPADVDGVVLRILSLIPGLSSAILGDYLSGHWTKRSESYRKRGELLLLALEKKNHVKQVQGERWFEWYVVSPVCEKIDSSKPQPHAVREFLTRYRLGVNDASSGPRLETKRSADLAHLTKLKSAPASEQNDDWRTEVAVYEEIMRKWDEGGRILKGH